jgi:hypothetical protein
VDHRDPSTEARHVPFPSAHMRDAITPEEAFEELRLWADYYESTTRALEIMRCEGTTPGTLPRIAAASARAAEALRRIKQIRELSD